MIFFYVAPNETNRNIIELHNYIYFNFICLFLSLVFNFKLNHMCINLIYDMVYIIWYTLLNCHYCALNKKKSNINWNFDLIFSTYRMFSNVTIQLIYRILNSPTCISTIFRTPKVKYLNKLVWIFENYTIYIK